MHSEQEISHRAIPFDSRSTGLDAQQMQTKRSVHAGSLRRERNARGRAEEGQSILEMAIVLPILLLLLVSVVDLARAFDAYIVLTNAVREGARFSSRDLDLTVADIQQLVVDDVLGSGTNVTHMSDFAASNVDVVIDIAGRIVVVTATYDYDLWFGGIVGLDTIQLQKESSMPIMIIP